MVIGDAWIEFGLTGQKLGEVGKVTSFADKNTLSVCDVFESVDLSYKVDTSLLTEMLILRESKEFESILQTIN